MKALVKVETSIAVQEYSGALNAMLDEWLADSDVTNELTLKSYRAAITVFLGWLRDGGYTLDRNTVKAYRQWLQANRATSTARTYFSILRIFVAWLAGRGFCPNYCDGVHTVKLDTSVHARDALTLEESVDVLSSFTGSDAKNLRDKAIMALLICCGLRTCEVCRLDFGDIEHRRGQWRLKIWGKGRAGKDATVILPVEVKSLIDTYLASRGAVGKKDPLFVSTSRRNKNQRLQPQTISRLAKKTFDAVGIDSERVTAHSCRHTCASLGLDFGCSLDEVSKTLRHRSVSVTEVYRHDQIADRNQTTRTVARAIFSSIAKGDCV